MARIGKLDSSNYEEVVGNLKLDSRSNKLIFIKEIFKRSLAELAAN